MSECNICLQTKDQSLNCMRCKQSVCKDCVIVLKDMRKLQCPYCRLDNFVSCFQKEEEIRRKKEKRQRRREIRSEFIRTAIYLERYRLEGIPFFHARELSERNHTYLQYLRDIQREFLASVEELESLNQ
jgi:hypothetical protein